MPNNSPEEPFSPDIQAAFRDYESPPLSPAFEARFWSRFEARRGRYRGFGGFWRRLWELEIEGVAVWRLALSTFSGGAVCALFFGMFSLLAAPAPNSRVASEPHLPEPETPRMVFDGRHFAGRDFYARQWELRPESQPQLAPRQRASFKGGVSWTGSKNGWA